MKENTGMAFDAWIEGFHTAEELSPMVRRTLRVIAQQPERSSYATARELAAMAGVDVSTVTRSAQALGFAGWPELRAELRAQYLKSLSLVEIAERHGTATSRSATNRSIDADRRTLALLRPDAGVISSVVSALATAERRVTTGGGSYGTAAQLLANHCTLFGYPTASPPDGAALASALTPFGQGDTLVAFGLWRPYQSTILATRVAAEAGATVCVITDAGASALTEHADHVIMVSSEGGSYVPTLTGVIAMVNVVCAELAELDPAKTAASLARAESTWADFLLQPPRS
jgi:DNA-binding MurR/RpiR family transcriptional regulator